MKLPSWKTVCVVILTLLLVNLCFVGPVYWCYYYIPPENVWVREYEAGAEECVGQVNVMRFLAWGDEFEIGANSEGVAVFKHPFLAFWTFRWRYAEEIKAVQERFDLGLLTQFNYRPYLILGSQCPNDPGAHMVSLFLDIYENSFD